MQPQTLGAILLVLLVLYAELRTQVQTADRNRKRRIERTRIH